MDIQEQMGWISCIDGAVDVAKQKYTTAHLGWAFCSLLAAVLVGGFCILVLFLWFVATVLNRSRLRTRLSRAAALKRELQMGNVPTRRQMRLLK